MRVSTDHQTIETQRSILQKYVTDKGWDCTFFEEIESSRKTRPVKAALLNKLRAKEYDGVIVSRLDRFARSSRELLIEIDELIKKKLIFISVTDNLDFSSASGRLHFQILAAFAEFERSLISQRTREALSRIKNIEGRHIGRPVGSKDKSKRRKSGYYLREARKRMLLDEGKGVYQSFEHYINPTNK